MRSVLPRVPSPICACYPCSDSICLGSVSPSPYKVALHKSHSEQGIAPELHPCSHPILCYQPLAISLPSPTPFLPSFCWTVGFTPFSGHPEKRSVKREKEVCP